jgi:hypothetical protein
VEALRLSGTGRIAAVSVFSALAIATDYAMLPLTNVKLMDSIVFVSSMAFGLGVGVSVGALTWLVYGSVNPQGPDGGFLLVILIASETIYALLGYLARRWTNLDEAGIPSTRLFWGSLGLMGAFVYDFATIIPPALISGVSPLTAFATLVPAIPFMVAHEMSDFAFFAIAAPAMYGAVLRVGRQKVGWTSIKKPGATPHSVDSLAGSDIKLA